MEIIAKPGTALEQTIKAMHDSERNRYFLLCSDTIPQAFDKKKLAKDQFDIEYE